jgi:hypothetical protein
MPTIDQSKLPIEITSKYSIVNNAFKLDKVVNAELDTYKNEPKDEINVEIGDSKQTEFYPQIKLMRWTNETNFSVRLKDTEYEKATITTDKDKIIWDKDNIKIEFFDYAEGEGGHKMIWFLKEKPLTNKVEFSLQSKGLDFFRQPPLTEEYQNGYSEEFQKEIVVTETQVKDLEGNVLVERPENVVGSYAVYHSTKGGMNDINGKEYKTGQMGMIYPSHLTDAEGKESKVKLVIDVINSTFTEEIPQDFLDTAVYPIRGNTDFGYTTLAGTASAVSNIVSGSRDTSGGTGTLVNITAGTYRAATTAKEKCALYDDASPGNLIANSDTPEKTGVIAKEWEVFTPTSPPSISNQYYKIILWGNGVNSTGYWNTTSGINKYYYKTAVTYNGFPGTITFGSYDGYSWSTYATYTPAGGGPANLKTYNTNAKANIKSIDTNLIANVKTLNTNA